MEVGGNRWLFFYTYYYAVLYVSIQWKVMLDIYTYDTHSETNFLAGNYIGLVIEMNL